MTIYKMVLKYSQILKDGHEYVSIHEVINDLRQCLPNLPKKKRK